MVPVFVSQVLHVLNEKPGKHRVNFVLSYLFRFLYSIFLFFVPFTYSLFLCLAAEPLDGDEYLDIIGIMRNQAGRYECKASNDVATPDVKYVNVVVNCKYGTFSVPNQKLITILTTFYVILFVINPIKAYKSQVWR